MRLLYKNQLRVFLFLISLFLFVAVQSKAQSKSYWKTTEKRKDAVIIENKLNLTHYKLFELDVQMLRVALGNAPKRGSGKRNSGVVISFPNANGDVESFHVFETSNMDPELAASYPEIKSYVGNGIVDPTAIIYFSLSPLGLQTMVIRADKPAVFIEPYTKDLSAYVVYQKSDKTESLLTPFECRIATTVTESMAGETIAQRPNADDATLRSFRLALSVTGEYTTYFGGTVALALAAMNNTMTRVNGVCEIDFCVHMNMIANESAIIYTNAATDPYSAAAAGAGGAWNQELQTNLTNTIGNANYDIGHLFGASGGGGNAGCIGCVCTSPTGGVPLGKGSGFTSPADAIPMGDNFDIDYVVHEMGHQFGANHTFTFSNEGTGKQDEPGSGSTIMGYAGITGSTDVQPHSDAYFHAISIEQVTNYIKTTTCQTTSATGNAIPTADAGLDYTIPKGTPFALTGVGTDANDAGLTYCWEQMNSGTSTTTFPNVTATSGPAFRSYSPVSSPTRYFPRLTTVQAGATSWTWEAVPNVARTMAFRFTVRDNHSGGPANNSDDMVVTVSTASGPFIVTAPNTAVTWTSGTTQAVTWNVASTTALPVSCANVKISLSIDGGNTFPIIIKASTPNDGIDSIIVPNNPTTLARIKVEAVGNIFYDISNVNFTIIGGSAVLSTISTQPVTTTLCEGASVSVGYAVDGPATSGNIFTAQLSNSSGSFASPVNIGAFNSIASGTITAVIPMGTATGSGYRIRVVSSTPAVTGSDNGANISIYGIPAAAGNINGNAMVCQGQNSVVYSVASIVNATGYTWTLPSGYNIASGANTNNITLNFSAAASSGVMTVQGINPGCSGTVSPNFNVIVNVLPSAAGTITGITSVCQSQTGVAYSVPSISGATSYTWTVPAGASITGGNNTNSIIVAYSASAVSGNIIVAGTNGCGNGTASSLSVSVNATATAAVVSVAGSTTVCSPSTVSLSFTAIAGVNYQWRLNGTNIIGATSSSYVATQSGNYDVVATGTVSQTFTNSTYFSIPDNSCTGVASPVLVSGFSSNVTSSKIFIKIDSLVHTWDGDLVIFLQAPTGEILGLANLVGSSGDNFINTVFADSGSARLPATGAPYSGLYKPWTAAFTSCITSTDSTFAGLGAGSINPNGTWTLRAYDHASADTGSIRRWSITFPAGGVSGCSSTSNGIAVSINPGGAADVAIAAIPSGSICSGTNVTFTATPSNGGTTPVYQWKKNGVNVGTNSTIYSDNTLNNNDAIACVMTSNSACVSGSPVTSNSILMTVNSSVTASVSIAASPSSTICSGTNVTFIASSTNGGTPPSYQWKKNGVNVGANSTIYSVGGLNNNDVIICVMTSNATCATGSPVTSNAITMTVNANVTASASIVANPSAIICAGTNVTFIATPVHGGTIPVYQWKKNGVNVGTNSSSYSNNALNNSDAISCVMTSNATCVNGSPATSNSIAMTVNANVTASVSIVANPSAIICSGVSVTFTATPVHGGTTPFYQWKKNGLAVGINSATYTANTLLNGDQIICEMTSNEVCVQPQGATISNPVTVTVISCSSWTLNLKVYIEGFYIGNGLMKPIIDAIGQPTICDTITVELRKDVAPFDSVERIKGVISTSGNGSFVFSFATSGNAYFIVVRHRNGMVTWSRNAIVFNNGTINYDFTTP